MGNRHIRLRALLAAGIGSALLFTGSGADADALPGAGVSVQPISTGRLDHYFQEYVVEIGLQQLGYETEPFLEAQFPALHLALGQGDADYTSVHWDPLHVAFYEEAGGDATLQRVGHLISNAQQGYLIDRKTAEAYGITNLEQLQQPEIAALFDSDGDGKANMVGCNPGWGCERVIEHQLDAFELRDSISHDQGEYFALIADAITRFNQGDPILYYTWSPLWVSSILQPGKDTVWLDVPFSTLPDRENVDTAMADGHNRGFEVNTIRVLANKAFLEANPAAARFLSLVEIPIADVNNAILKQHDGAATPEAIHAEAEAWIAAHQAEFDGWVAEAAAVK